MILLSFFVSHRVRVSSQKRCFDTCAFGRVSVPDMKAEHAATTFKSKLFLPRFLFMSYLDDPRVFLATERTLLAWIRTEIAILAFAFLIKKLGMDSAASVQYATEMNMVVGFLCLTTIVVSVLSCIQTYITLGKLGEQELPGPMAKKLVMSTGALSVVISMVMSAAVMMV